MDSSGPKSNSDRSAADIAAQLEDVSVKLSRTATWSGIETQNAYGPADVEGMDYSRDLGDPGEYPYTRGAFPEMYRSRMWTLRNIVGYGAPEDTREGIEKALKLGTAGVNIVLDTLSQEAVDPDHPAFSPDAGQEGCSLPTVRDLEVLLAGIDVTRTGVAWHTTMMIYPLVVAMAKKQGKDLSQLIGSHMPDHLQLRLSVGNESTVPTALGHRTTVDCLEYSSKNTPRWSLGCPQAYNLRERGVPASGEIALGMAIVKLTLRDLAARGVGVDQVAPSMAWVSGADIDFFEEVAKFRALRRIWARTMKEQFGSQDARSQRLRIACHTSGRALVYPQPLNNLARATVQTLAALLGGVQSLETCTWDEPICIPTEDARELATRTQQILANEVGAARTADPLGGSWYVESLTNQVEADALGLLEKIEGIGLIKAIEDGTIEGLMDDYNYQFKKEMDRGERIVVGVNKFIPKPEPAPKRFSFDPKGMLAHLERFRALKVGRDQTLLKEKIAQLYRAVRSGENAHPAMIEALIADASIGEVWGTVRVASGLAYDPFRVVESPFTYPTI
jgi:methylmalonyl-CoA mutase N-terminal domain/subunit